MLLIISLVTQTSTAQDSTDQHSGCALADFYTCI